MTGRIGLLVAIVLAAADARGAPRLELVAETTPPLAVTARNVGDEPADDVAPAVVYQHRTWTGDAVRLDPGTGHDWRFDLPSPPEPGTAPAIVRVRYRDPRGRTRGVPLVVALGPYGPPGPVDAKLESGPVQGAGHGTLALVSAYVNVGPP